MKILVMGGKGMLGRSIGTCLAGHCIRVADLPETDIARRSAVEKTVSCFRPDLVVHCAAMTAVDACETDVDRALAVNALGSANVAVCAYRAGARLIAISTDYVFSGDAARPYHEWDDPGPKTAYGRSKLAGEESVRAHCPDHTILRTAWLYGAGGPSFVHTMLRLGREEGLPLKVVDDQRGNPTSTGVVADVIARLVEEPIPGTIHAVCEGDATWYGLACEVFRLAGLKREIVPCTTEEFPRPAPRPKDSRLENRVLRLAGWGSLPHWRDALAEAFPSL